MFVLKGKRERKKERKRINNNKNSTISRLSYDIAFDTLLLVRSCFVLKKLLYKFSCFFSSSYVSTSIIIMYASQF